LVFVAIEKQTILLELGFLQMLLGVRDFILFYFIFLGCFLLGRVTVVVVVAVAR
jgi:hypothetical protein